MLFDDRTATLSVVTADPDDERALHEVKLAKPAIREIEVLVARPAAVRAAISFHYRGDKAAFRALLPAAAVLEAEGRIPVPRARRGPLLRVDPARERPAQRSARHAARASASTRERPAAAADPAASRPARRGAGRLGRRRGVGALHRDAPHPRHLLRAPARRSRRALHRRRGAVRQACEGMGLDRDHTAALVVAAYLHDLGKGEGSHLTALDVAKDEALGDIARRCLGLPAPITASLDLAPETEAALGAMYERWDGRGLPHGLPARTSRSARASSRRSDTYADLTQNPGNRYRRILRPFEACAVLLKYGGGIFDPEVVDANRRAMMGTDDRRRC